MTDSLPPVNKCECGCCHVPDHGPCPTYEIGANGRCVYCDHGKACHADQSRPYFNTPLGVGRRMTDSRPPAAPAPKPTFLTKEWCLEMARREADLESIEAIRGDEAVRDAFVECYTLQGIITDNGMNVDPDQLREWDRVESALIRAILGAARGAAPAPPDVIAHRLAVIEGMLSRQRMVPLSDVRFLLDLVAARGAAPAPLDPHGLTTAARILSFAKVHGYDEGETWWPEFAESVGAFLDSDGAWPWHPDHDVEGVLVDVCQLLDGWHQDGTVWSTWDEQVRQRVGALLRKVHDLNEAGSAHRGAPEPSEALPAIPGTQEYHHCAICERKTPHRFRLVCLDHRSGYDMPLDDLLSAARVFPRQATFEKASDYAARVREWLVDVAAVRVAPAPGPDDEQIAAATKEGVNVARDGWVDGMEFDDAVSMGIGVAFGLARVSGEPDAATLLGGPAPAPEPPAREELATLCRETADSLVRIAEILGALAGAPVSERPAPEPPGT